MPSRLIRSDLLESERVQTMPVEARWLFVSILLTADDLGLFEAGAFRLARHAGIEMGPCQIHMQALVDADLIRLYEVSGRRLGFVPRFRQKLKILRTKFPMPPPSLMADDEDAQAKISVFNRAAAGEVAAPFGVKWERLRSAILARDGGECIRCSSSESQSAHHLTPKSLGGSHTASNLITLCSSCNSWARNNEQRCNEIKELAAKKYPHGIPEVSVGTPEPEPEPLKEISKLSLASGPADRPEPASAPSDSKCLPACPHRLVLALWEKVLPALPQHEPDQWRGARADHLRARWRETAAKNKWTEHAQGLAYFEKLFRFVGRSPFLTGHAPPTPNRRVFYVTLEWLVKPANWAKVIEGNYHEVQP